MHDSDDENYCVFGEPLEPLDEENLPKNKAISVEDQYATDGQGRRRFHGAFTGGFSAGYFNSVGTRDGWKPQQFKSSRTSKAQNQVTQRPEDFMDEEDTNEFGIAPTGIRASCQYSIRGKGIKRKERCTMEKEEGVIPGVAVLKEIVEPVTETVGIALLKKMGWKPGQGVGPRLTKKEKKKIRQKIYGCAMPDRGEIDNSSGDDNDDGVLFAPDDYDDEAFQFKPKDNYFGIGYTGLERRSILGHINLFDSASEFKVEDKDKKFSIRGQAFGVGAFEADDEDIYGHEDMSNYDFSLGPEKTKKARWSDNNKSLSSCSFNCTLSFEGFVSGGNFFPRNKHFSAPELPKDFKPIHVVRKSRFSSPPKEIAADRSTHFTNQFNDRSSIIEEKKQPSIVANEKSGKSWLDKLNSTSFVSGGIEGAANKQSEEKEKSCIIVEENNEKNEWQQEKVKQTGKTNEASCGNLIENPQEAAAQMKMFGKLTRVIEPWQPSSIVCKRFNIPEIKTTIYHSPTTQSLASSVQLKNSFSIFHSFANQHDKIQTLEDSLPNIATTSKTTTSCENLQKIRDFELTYEKLFGKNVQVEEKPSIDTSASEETHNNNNNNKKKDLFKAIFLSSSESSEESGGEEDTANNGGDGDDDDENVKSLLIGKPSIATATDEINQQRNSSPARGIFAKIDLDNLIDPSKEVTQMPSMTNDEREEASETLAASQSDHVYGPALPTTSSHSGNIKKSHFPGCTSVECDTETSTTLKWVEKKKHKKDKKKKHKHVEKHKHKHRHKSKKK